MTVQQLRNNGYKVRVLHYRLPNRVETGGWSATGIVRDAVRLQGCDFKPKGGRTKLIIDSPSGEHYEGESICSKRDNYNKKLGVRIALGRCNFGKTFYAQAETTNE